MDSSISPLFISRYRKDNNFFKKTYPNTIRPQAKDIIRTWLHYTNLRCYQLTNKQAFDSAWIMGYGVDEKGERMSKSKGNVVDPIPILEKYHVPRENCLAKRYLSIPASNKPMLPDVIPLKPI